jgi:hypothetical protein
MASSINAITTGSGGVVTTADNSGDLNIQSGGSTKIAVTSAGVAVTGLSKGSLPTGSVLQVVSFTYATLVSTTSTSGISTGVTVSITPTSATSKVLVNYNINGVQLTSATNGNVYTDLYRNGSKILNNVTGSQFGTGYSPEYSVGFSYLDSPATTSSTAYDVYFKIGGGSGTAYVQGYSERSTITLMEIAA